MRAAAGLVGQPDLLSLHPGGVVVTPGPLTDWLPTQWAPKGFLSTQYEHTDVEALGLPKMDLLGIRALTVLADAVALVRLHHDPGFSLEELPRDDATTAALLARGETIGVFQCESEGAQTTLRKLRASTVRDLAVANAFFKPGPATGGMASAFVRRYRGEERVSYLHPTLEVILGPTQGVRLSQEQILRVAREIAGLSWEQADQLRKGMSHFGVGQMTALRDQFVAGCQRQPRDGPGLIASQAGTLWEQVVAFAGYGFNQGHATAYADVSYRSAYLKTHWPAAFLCARLADHGGFHHPTIYIAEAQRLGIVVRPPHVNHSGPAFTYAPGTGRAILWMGLGQVRDLRQRAVEEIIVARGTRPFVSLHDLITRTTLQQREILHLIRSGALDGLGLSRHVLQDEASSAHRAHRRARSPDQLPLLPTEEETAPAESTSPDGLARPDAAQLRDYLQWEKQLLGFPVSSHPLALFHEQLPAHTPLEQIGLVRNRAVTTAGARLPGWTGGNSFFLGNGVTFVTVRVHRESPLRPPAPWQPVLIEGRWQEDQYGSHWLLAERITEAGPSFDAP
jgi:DNA polymerase III alpha subunit